MSDQWCLSELKGGECGEDESESGEGGEGGEGEEGLGSYASHKLLIQTRS